MCNLLCWDKGSIVMQPGEIGYDISIQILAVFLSTYFDAHLEVWWEQQNHKGFCEKVYARLRWVLPFSVKSCGGPNWKTGVEDKVGRAWFIDRQVWWSEQKNEMSTKNSNKIFCSFLIHFFGFELLYSFFCWVQFQFSFYLIGDCERSCRSLWMLIINEYVPVHPVVL